MHSFRANSLGVLMAIALSGIIVVILIVPNLGFPDTALQRNHLIQVVQVLSHQVLPGSPHTAYFRFSLAAENASIRAGHVQEIRAGSSDDLTIKYEALRC
jgi:hypothetical protein